MSSRRWKPWAVGLASSLFYLAFHSCFYNFDGVACAIAVELGDLAHLAHGNHLAYGLLGLGFDRLWRLFGYRGQALVLLQTLDSLLGGATVGLFCALLRRLGLRSPLTWSCPAALAVSWAFWFWSLEAQVYVLGAFFLAWTAWELARRAQRPSLVGLLHGLAVLGHVGHLMFLPCAWYWLDRKNRGRYLASLAATVITAYALAALFCVKPHSLDAWRVWLLGSAALVPGKKFYWFGGWSPGNLLEWALMTPRLFSDAPFGLALALPALAAAAYGAFRGRRKLAVAASLWLGGHAVLYASWQPTTMVYRVADLLPLWLMIALALDAAPRKSLAWAPAAWALAAGLANGVLGVLPACDPARNAEYQDALSLGARIPENAWALANARGQVYLPYFARRRPLNLRYLDEPGALAGKIGALETAGDAVYASSATLAAAGPERLQGVLAFDEGGGVYRLRRKGSPRAAAGRN